MSYLKVTWYNTMFILQGDVTGGFNAPMLLTNRVVHVEMTSLLVIATGATLSRVYAWKVHAYR